MYDGLAVVDDGVFQVCMLGADKTSNTIELILICISFISIVILD